MSTTPTAATAATATGTTVPVTLEFKVTITTDEKADNAADVKRILANALERSAEVSTAAGNGASAVVVGTITIGKQKFKL